MRRDGTTTPDGSLVLSTQTAPAGRLAAVGRPARSRPRLRVPALGRPWGYLGLLLLVVGVSVFVVVAGAGTFLLVPHSRAGYPTWESGPLHMLIKKVNLPPTTIEAGVSVLLVSMLAVWAIVLMAARSLSLRTIVVVLVGLNLIIVLCPPTQLNDVFNYLAYARLGALHGINPYRHGSIDESYDPIFLLSRWRHYPSPYGPLYTALTYPLALLPIPVAYWVLKFVTIGCSLVLMWLLVRCARLLGRDPRMVLTIVVASPVYLLYLLCQYHNDIFMLLPSVGAIVLLLERRDRAAGAVTTLAMAVKFTSVLLLPFLLVGVRTKERRLRVITGAVLAAIPMIVMQLLLFGTALPNLADQSRLVSEYSIPNLLGNLLGQGGATITLTRILNVCVILVALWCLRRRDWIGGAGWTTFALVASLSWLMAWYIAWVLPFAALSASARLRRATILFSVFSVLTFVPEFQPIMLQLGVRPMSSSVGEAALNYVHKLES